MRVRVETSCLGFASARLRDIADSARDLSASIRRATVLDPDVDAGLSQVTGVAGDALDVVGLDLDLVIRSLRTGALTYRDVEKTVADAAGHVRP